MAYYKRELQLKRTLKSMERSGYKDFNVIIVDDASDDGLEIPETTFKVELITITKEEKTWNNPEPVYNKGIIYDDFVVEKELPDKMTLEKIPDLTIQNAIAPIEFEYNIIRGMNMVLYNVEKRLNNGGK